MILDDYINYHNTYSQKYGDLTIVVIQVGDFFELYAYYDSNEAIVGPNLSKICDLCNLQLTRKNKAILEATAKNPMMAGFPLYILTKHVQTLTGAGYTVVVVRQVTAPPNPKRDVTDVFSPATQLNASNQDGSYLVVMAWGNYGAPGAARYTAVGMAAVDVSSGETVVYETASRPDNVNEAEDEAIRWMSAFSPREMVIIGDGYDRELFAERNVHWGCDWHRDGDKFESIAYQNELYRRAFDCTKTGILSPIEAIGLTHFALARTALAALLQFVHDHNEALVEQLQNPRFLSPKGHLHLACNSAQQLNIISTGHAGERPLLSLLNRCSTAFGGRAFKDRLLHPIVDATELQARYDSVDKFMKMPPEQLATIRRHLSGVQDLQRMARRLSVRKFAPMEWPALISSLEAATAALDGVAVDAMFIPDVSSVLDVNECSKFNSNDVRTNVFCDGVFPEVDAIALAFSNSTAYFAQVVLDLGDSIVRMEVNERDGYYLTTTKRRWENLLKQTNSKSYQLEDGQAITLKPISASSSTYRLVHPILAAKSERATSAATRLRSAAGEAYREWLESNGVALAHRLRDWIEPIANLDIAVTNARNAMDFAYTRPTLTHDSDAPLAISQLRHPMIERFLTDMAYVPNDVVIGEKEKETGWLLYGMNAAGKSSLMKAVGLAVVMAQAGMYVPAVSMTFTPFEHIFTRISGSDNIYRGMSSFVVEMTELRNILQRAQGPSSLVLGDELCAGTESLSAVAIVSAGVNELVRRQCRFIFATHLHDLVDLPMLAHDKLRVCHMHVEVGQTGGLVYDRTLRPGIGHRTYGIEVCRGLGMPDSFLKEADVVRRSLQGIPEQLISTKTASYNSGVFVDKCGVCNAVATEVHHIKYQKDADAAGRHGHVSQHHASNLVPLCEACHKKEHSGELHVIGWVQTTKGRVLKVTHSLMTDACNRRLKSKE